MEVDLKAVIHIRTCMHKNNLLMYFEMYVYVCVCMYVCISIGYMVQLEIGNIRDLWVRVQVHA